MTFLIFLLFGTSTGAKTHATFKRYRSNNECYWVFYNPRWWEVWL